jgi:hypothetical protein
MMMNDWSHLISSHFICWLFDDDLIFIFHHPSRCACREILLFLFASPHVLSPASNADCLSQFLCWAVRVCLWIRSHITASTATDRNTHHRSSGPRDKRQNISTADNYVNEWSYISHLSLGCCRSCCAAVSVCCISQQVTWVLPPFHLHCFIHWWWIVKGYYSTWHQINRSNSNIGDLIQNIQMNHYYIPSTVREQMRWHDTRHYSNII